MPTVAIAGNPNAGKSTIFNALTGSHQHVGNWPGKTVEKKEGHLLVDGQDVIIVDLPGTYSLNALSLEEVIARDFVLLGKPDAVVCVVDSANLERNLYLVVQVFELGVPVVLALNMQDVAERRGIEIDTEKLSALLGDAAVIPTIGSRNVGLDELRRAIASLPARPKTQALPLLTLPETLQTHLDAVSAMVAKEPAFAAWPPRWFAAKLLEGDSQIRPLINGRKELVAAVTAAQAEIASTTGDDADVLFADARYQFIGTLIDQVVQRPSEHVVTRSDQIDKVMTHRLWGVPIFLLMMWFVFQLTANLSAPLLDFTDYFVNTFIGGWVERFVTALGMQGTWLSSLLVGGVVAGVGGVLVFVPVLLSLYFAIGVLEDSGYMSRAAFVMDNLMNRLGLHGKSFLPLLVGFGCTVPAIYATRTLENARDRKVTGFVATFMSCGARLPVYVLFGAAFFGARGGALTFAMYVLGILVAIGTSMILTRYVYRSRATSPFVMELPPYRFPSMRTVGRSMTERTTNFVRKAGKIIFLASFSIWLLLSIPMPGANAKFAEVDPADSLFGSVSSVLAPVFTPAGFGNWQAAGSLITGFVAKEVIVSSMAQVYGVAESGSTSEALPTMFESIKDLALNFVNAIALTVQELFNVIPRTLNLIPGATVPEVQVIAPAADDGDTSGLEAALASAFTPAAALAFVIFILLYVPCMSATAAMKHEFGTRWMMTQLVYTLCLAWIAAVLVFQAGTVMGF